MKETIESKAAGAILQKPIEVTVGSETYFVARPSTATIILVSELVAQMPQVDLSEDNVLKETLFIAKDCRVLGDIVATLILGSKGLEEVVTVEKSRFFGLKKEVTSVTVDRKTELAEKLLSELEPKELAYTANTILNQMQVGFFFGLSTSLIEINLLRKTRGVKTETTASGQQSPQSPGSTV